ncbi:hypothetical protein P7K49_016682 [Saguinus oedipus]|uniref:Uncharacterized protein n=1 Tax=Saguinus oedipus TaxID=9490 RepID=A0ABQ9VES3_SAGOE|nr:hypothetical protein P7K49_016682 [Saguinus oedipus]
MVRCNFLGLWSSKCLATKAPKEMRVTILPQFVTPRSRQRFDIAFVFDVVSEPFKAISCLRGTPSPTHRKVSSAFLLAAPNLPIGFVSLVPVACYPRYREIISSDCQYNSSYSDPTASRFQTGSGSYSSSSSSGDMMASTAGASIFSSRKAVAGLPFPQAGATSGQEEQQPRGGRSDVRTSASMGGSRTALWESGMRAARASAVLPPITAPETPPSSSRCAKASLSVAKSRDPVGLEPPLPAPQQ